MIHHHALPAPHTRTGERWVQVTTTMPGPFPTPQGCRSHAMEGGRAWAGCCCPGWVPAPSPLCLWDEAPEDVAMPGPSPAGLWDRCLGCVQWLPALWPPSHQGLERGWGLRGVWVRNTARGPGARPVMDQLPGLAMIRVGVITWGQKTGGSATLHKRRTPQWGLCRGGVLG